MSWLQKLLPPKIKRSEGGRKSVPEGLWTKCPACESVLYSTDLENNQNVCPKCGHHHRLRARARLDLLLDPEGRFEIGAEVVPLDPLKFKDSRRYPDRLAAANEETGEADALVVMQGAIKTVPVVVACFEFEFMGGSMGSVVGEKFVRGVRAALEQQTPFICITASGGARMQEGLFSLMQMAKTTAAVTLLARETVALHHAADRPDHGRRVRQFRLCRRCGARRTGRPDRFCRATRDRADGPRDLAGRVSAGRVSDGQRRHRHDRRPPPVA